MRVLGITAIGLLGLLASGTMAQPPASEAQLAAAQGKGAYDIVANCLMREMTGPRFVAWPLVYAPPRQEALVNVWLRGREYDVPVATFRVIQEAGGTTQVTFLPTPGAAGPSHQSAEAAIRRCTR